MGSWGRAPKGRAITAVEKAVGEGDIWQKPTEPVRRFAVVQPVLEAFPEEPGRRHHVLARALTFTEPAKDIGGHSSVGRERMDSPEKGLDDASGKP